MVGNSNQNYEEDKSSQTNHQEYARLYQSATGSMVQVPNISPSASHTPQPEKKVDL